MLNLSPVLLVALLCFFPALFSPVSAGDASCVHGVCQRGTVPARPSDCSRAPTDLPNGKREEALALEMRDDGTTTYDGASLLPRHVGARNAVTHLRRRQTDEPDISSIESTPKSLVERGNGICYYPMMNSDDPIGNGITTGLFVLNVGTWSLDWLLTDPSSAAFSKLTHCIHLQIFKSTLIVLRCSLLVIDYT